MISNPDALSDLTAFSINVNGQTYLTKASTSSGSSSTSSSSDYTALIVIVVVGLVGSAIVVVAVYFGIQKYEQHHQRSLLINEPTDESVAPQTEAGKNNIPLRQQILSSVGLSSKNTNQVKPLMTAMETTDRPVSGAVSVSMLEFTSANNDDRTNSSATTKKT